MLEIERKLIQTSAKGFSKILNASLSNTLLVAELEHDFAQSYMKNLSLAFVYGALFGVGETRNIRKRKLFAEDPEMQELVVYLKQALNPQLVISLSRRKFTSENEVIDEIFRPNVPAIAFLKDYCVTLAKIESHALLEKVTDAVRQTILQGMSQEEAEKYIQEIFKDFKAKRVRAIARTEATRAFNLGNISNTYEVVEGYRFTAVLDARTTTICQSRHGKFIPKNDTAALVFNSPPLHVNCRSYLIPEIERTDAPILETSNLPTPQKREIDIFDTLNFLKGVIGK